MPDGPELPVWAVLDSIATGQSASAGLAAYRAAGGEVRTQTWYRLHGEVQASLAGRIQEAAAPLNRRPTGEEVQTMSTTSAKGYLQQIEVLVRNRGTGEVEAKPFSVTGDQLISRGNAISQALDAFAGGVEEGSFEEQVLGAVHVGAYQMVPSE